MFTVKSQNQNKERNEKTKKIINNKTKREKKTRRTQRTVERTSEELYVTLCYVWCEVANVAMDIAIRDRPRRQRFPLITRGLDATFYKLDIFYIKHIGENKKISICKYI